MGTMPREVSIVSRPRRDYTPTPKSKELQAYLFGAVHDGTYNKHHHTFRIAQKDKDWLLRIQAILSKLTIRSWLYKEGRARNVHILESTIPFLNTSKQLRTKAEKIAYIRGYFDAEGGIPRSQTHGLYIQFVQKNRYELHELKGLLEELNIETGEIHNPSVRIDPEYYRFFIRRKSLQNFLALVGSNHPRKEKLIRFWLKI